MCFCRVVLLPLGNDVYSFSRLLFVTCTLLLSYSLTFTSMLALILSATVIFSYSLSLFNLFSFDSRGSIGQIQDRELML